MRSKVLNANTFDKVNQKQKGSDKAMAGVNFEKIKSAQHGKALIKHCDKEKRLQRQNHSNQQINKALSGSNMQYNNSTYESTCKRWDDRIAFLDTLEGQNKRKDRVILFGLEIPCPKDLPADKEVGWMNQVNQILLSRFGKENVMNLYFHRDEKHIYRDSETGEKRESRNHIHAFVVPEIDGKLNGKEFSSKKNMIDLNNQIQIMTQQQFGVDFMDGSKKRSNKSVESLKNASKQRETEELQQQAKEAIAEANKAKQEAEQTKQQYETALSNVQSIRDTTTELAMDCKRLNGYLKADVDKQQSAKLYEKQIESRESRLEALNESLLGLPSQNSKDSQISL